MRECHTSALCHEIVSTQQASKSAQLASNTWNSLRCSWHKQNLVLVHSCNVGCRHGPAPPGPMSATRWLLAFLISNPEIAFQQRNQYRQQPASCKSKGSVIAKKPPYVMQTQSHKLHKHYHAQCVTQESWTCATPESDCRDLWIQQILLHYFLTWRNNDNVGLVLVFFISLQSILTSSALFCQIVNKYASTGSVGTLSSKVFEKCLL